MKRNSPHPYLVAERAKHNATDSKTCNICDKELTYHEFSFGPFEDGFERKCKACTHDLYTIRMDKRYAGISVPVPVLVPTPAIDLTMLIGITQQLINFIEFHTPQIKNSL